MCLRCRAPSGSNGGNRTRRHSGAGAFPCSGDRCLSCRALRLKGNVLPEGATIKDLTNYGSRAGSGQPFGGQTLPLPKPSRACQTFCYRKSEGFMADTAKRMGRPPGEPSKVVRLPLPVAALAKRLAEKSLRAGDINAFFDIEARRAATVPLMATSAACGFPSPADDYLDRPLDFNELLIENPAATFAVRIESMTGAGLFPGDIAVVDRARTAVDG